MLETVDTKVCPNGLVVSKNSACLSSRYTYYSPSGGGVGATLIQFRPYCVPDGTTAAASMLHSKQTATTIANLVKQQDDSCCTIKSAYLSLRQEGEKCCARQANAANRCSGA